MNRGVLAFGCVALLAFVGCETKPQVGEADTSQTKAFDEKGMDTSGMGKQRDMERVNPAITVKFIGRHKGDEPKPRHLSFMMAEGQMFMPKGEWLALESMKLGFYTEMLEVDAEASGLDKEQAAKLADHLRGPDFFNAKQHGTAEFEATSIKLNEDGTGTIVGKLKLLGQTAELTIPVTHNAEKKSLEAKFDLDRTQFGMNFGLDNIEEKIEVQITVKAG